MGMGILRPSLMPFDSSANIDSSAISIEAANIEIVIHGFHVLEQGLKPVDTAED